MAKSKKTKISPDTVKRVVIGILTIFFVGLCWKAGSIFLTTSNYFKVHAVFLDPALRFIERRDLSGIKGKNIFAVDIDAIDKKLTSRYPQIAELKILRRFPDQIHILARKRDPIAQIIFREHIITIDENGVILVSDGKLDPKFPLVRGLTLSNQRLATGLSLRPQRDLYAAIEIIRQFKSSAMMPTLSIREVESVSASQINLYLSNNLKVILDSDNVGEKIRTLAVIMSEGGLQLSEVNYIDLRFRDPILGKK